MFVSQADACLEWLTNNRSATEEVFISKHEELIKNMELKEKHSVPKKHVPQRRKVKTLMTCLMDGVAASDSDDYETAFDEYHTGV